MVLELNLGQMEPPIKETILKERNTEQDSLYGLTDQITVEISLETTLKAKVSKVTKAVRRIRMGRWQEIQRLMETK